MSKFAAHSWTIENRNHAYSAGKMHTDGFMMKRRADVAVAPSDEVDAQTRGCWLTLLRWVDIAER